MTSETIYVLRRNVGTVGRPILACAVCNFSPAGHVLSAAGAPDRGLCNIHAQGLARDAPVSVSMLDAMRAAWLDARG